MKRTPFLLASLTAIALLSCSSDNLPSSAEDVSYPTKPALKRTIPIEVGQVSALIPQSDEIQGIDLGQATINATTKKCVSCGSMSVTVNYPWDDWSSDAVCDFTSLPAGSKNVSYQFTGSGPTGAGSFSTDYIYIECGNYYGYFNALSIANIYTSAFANTPANVKCYVSFHGKCNGTAYGGGACTLKVSNIQGCQEYN